VAGQKPHGATLRIAVLGCSIGAAHIAAFYFVEIVTELPLDCRCSFVLRNYDCIHICIKKIKLFY